MRTTPEPSSTPESRALTGGLDWRPFPNDRTEYVVPVAPVTARHVGLRALSEHGDQDRFAAVTELDVVRAR
ncbi:hypothetical protein [Streptomyces sp. NPDC056975]|uniref:hypothetical protein n=1 Tax=unclassified Streptomyces TaxID=2593676 RepID=UPI003637B219